MGKVRTRGGNRKEKAIMTRLQSERHTSYSREASNSLSEYCHVPDPVEHVASYLQGSEVKDMMEEIRSL